jgi:hypothetical protein
MPLRICACFSPTSTFVKRYTAGSTTRRQSGIEATLISMEVGNVTAVTMTGGESCPSIRRRVVGLAKCSTNGTPETITIDDDSESEVELKTLYCFCVRVTGSPCACYCLMISSSRGAVTVRHHNNSRHLLSAPMCRVAVRIALNEGKVFFLNVDCIKRQVR